MNTREMTKKELLEIFETYESRVEMLTNEQIVLVRLFQNRPNYKFLAKMAKVNGATVSRRLKKIAHHLTTGNFMTDFSVNDVPPEIKKIVINLFKNEMSMRAIEKNTGLSAYKIKKIIKQMRIL